MANKLIVAPAPHVQTAQSTTRIMRDVVIALMPALVVSTVVFGLDVLRVTALSVVSCVVIEYLIQKFMVRGATTVGNWSAVVTGVLLAFNLPASIPWWIVVMGAFGAIAVAKMTFGGLGKNPFNPALVGRVFLLIAYPVQMTTWPLPVNGSFDVLSGATPLAAVKQGLAGPGAIGVQEMLLGNIPGSLGEVAAAALLCGFVYLLWRRVITWHIPVTVLATMAVLIMSNLVISLIKNIIPDKVRIPAFIVVIASFVTIIQMLMQAYVPALYGALGVFIPLIVVNCIILGRAEAFASKNSPLDSILDGVGIGLGFTLALTVIGAVREILGSGAIFGVNLGFADVAPLIFVLAPGAFLVLGYLMVLFNKLAKK